MHIIIDMHLNEYYNKIHKIFQANHIFSEYCKGYLFFVGKLVCSVFPKVYFAQRKGDSSEKKKIMCYKKGPGGNGSGCHDA